MTTSMSNVAQTTVLGLLVYRLTGSELDLGFLGLAEFAPAALLVLIGTLFSPPSSGLSLLPAARPATEKPAWARKFRLVIGSIIVLSP